MGLGARGRGLELLGDHLALVPVRRAHLVRVRVRVRVGAGAGVGAGVGVGFGVRVRVR